MSSIVRFSVNGLPQTKGSASAFPKKRSSRDSVGDFILGRKQKTVVVNANQKNKEWEKKIQRQAFLHYQVNKLWEQPVALRLIFRLKKPKAHPKSKHVFHTKKPDLDKLIRSVVDALTGVVYKDDNQVCSIHSRKEYSNNPGVDIAVINIDLLTGGKK